MQTVAVSKAIADDIHRWLPNASPVIIPNGIDIHHFSPGVGDSEKLDALAAMSLRLKTQFASAWSRPMRGGKGRRFFLRTAAKVMQREPSAPIRFYIVGGPIYATRGSQISRDELEQLAGELGVSSVAGFVPFQIDPVAIYRSLDVVVHASTDPEPFGLSIAEAMSCGRAVIVSAAAVARELFEDEVDALGIEPANPDALAAAMLRSARPPLRERLGASARNTAQNRFDRAQLGPSLLPIYREMLRR